jgi:hypothetical protein
MTPAQPFRFLAQCCNSHPWDRERPWLLCARAWVGWEPLGGPFPPLQNKNSTHSAGLVCDQRRQGDIHQTAFIFILPH